VVHRSRNLDRGDFTVREGFPVTSFVRTMLDLAARLDEDRIRSMLREAERLRIADWRELRRATGPGRGRTGIARLRAVVNEWTEADSATRSDLELRFLALCRRKNLPLPIVNGSVSGFEVDCTWPELRFAVELDGYETHRGRSSFESDRLRDMVVTRAGFQVVRVTDRMLKDRAEDLVALLGERLGVAV
jgi:very-short-patch-repair endonuclease